MAFVLMRSSRVETAGDFTASRCSFIGGRVVLQGCATVDALIGSREVEGGLMCPLPVFMVAIAAALSGSTATLAIVAAQSAEKSVQRSTTFEWTKLEAKATEVGARRDVMRSATPTLDELEIHITTLKAGAVSHPPHRHPEEELLIVREGTVETLQNGKSTRLGPGSIIFHASNDLHNIRNAGTTPATYHVIQWQVRCQGAKC
jgi:quercetin dioxygenase-like cupin family protein